MLPCCIALSCRPKCPAIAGSLFSQHLVADIPRNCNRVPQLEIERDFSTHSAPLRARLSVEMTRCQTWRAYGALKVISTKSLPETCRSWCFFGTANGRSTATSRILLPMKLRHSLVREEVHWPSRGSPASGGLRAGSALPRHEIRLFVRDDKSFPSNDLPK